MTQRKPPTMTMPGWIEHQIRTAEAQGAFENLPGAGKPIPGLGTPQDELAWVANYLRRENVDVAGLLPPALSIAKEVETLRETLVRVRAETEAREVVTELNARIDEAHARPQIGPVFRVKLVRVEPVIEQWRADRAALAEIERVRRAAAAPVSQPGRRRWWRRTG